MKLCKFTSFIHERKWHLKWNLKKISESSIGKKRRSLSSFLNPFFFSKACLFFRGKRCETAPAGDERKSRSSPSPSPATSARAADEVFDLPRRSFTFVFSFESTWTQQMKTASSRTHTHTHTHTHTISLKQRLITRRFRRRLFHFYDSWQYFQKGTSAIHAFLIGLLFQISWNLHDLEFLQISRWKEHFLKSIFKIRSPRRNWITQLK